MKPAKLAATLVIVAIAYTAPVPAQQLERRQIDAQHSTAQFSVSHVFVERVSGTVPIASGTVTLPAGSTIPTAITATLDAGGVNTGDSDRDESLRSPDFFDVKRFPTWSFVSKAIVPAGKGAFSVDGTLTIHGVAAPQHLDVTVSGDVANPTFHAVGQVDRHVFNMAITRLDAAIGTDVTITLQIQLQR